MSAALVTGASGFVGGHLVAELLARGVQVRCAVRKSSNRKELERHDVEFVETDLRDFEGLKRAINGVDVVYHLAAQMTGPRSQLMRVNAEGSANLARACASRTSPPVLVHVSSIAAAGPTTKGHPRTEGEAPAPVSDYGHSKRAGELSNAEWAHSVPTTIVRPGIIFGPNNRELLPVFQGIVLASTHIVITFSPPRLSLTEIGDLVRFLPVAAERGARLPARSADEESGTGSYFVCHPEYPDYRQLGKLISRAIGHRSLVVFHLGEPLPWIVGAGGLLAGLIRGRVPFVNIDKMREATAESWECSPAQAAQELSFACSAPLLEQLRATSEWYQEHGWYKLATFPHAI